ncbi:hypothetical protein OfM1_02780 [Lactovum odontotermitis]
MGKYRLIVQILDGELLILRISVGKRGDIHQRYGLVRNLVAAKSAGGKKLNDWYDLLCRDVLLYLFGQEHSDFAGAVVELKAQSD